MRRADHITPSGLTGLSGSCMAPSVISQNRPLLLGSRSPRRREILEQLQIPIRILPADVLEDPWPGEAPLPYLERIVRDKLSAVQKLAPAELCAAWLVADTTVVLDDSILGKPLDSAEAAALVTRLVGRTHTVYTRYAIARADMPDRPATFRTVASRVTLRAASPEEIRRYAETGEGLDKAGAYAVQGIGAFLIERIEGSYSNVVGLPACEVIMDLIDLRLLEHFP